jgi:hypothetical protein
MKTLCSQTFWDKQSHFELILSAIFAWISMMNLNSKMTMTFDSICEQRRDNILNKDFSTISHVLWCILFFSLTIHQNVQIFRFVQKYFSSIKYQLISCSCIQFSSFLSMKISWLMRIIRIIARSLNFIRSHWLIKSLKIDNNVFFLWFINEYTQLKKINSSMKCAMHVVLSNVLLQMINLKCNIWKNLIAFANDIR